jgi:hypothetical protein
LNRFINGRRDRISAPTRQKTRFSAVQQLAACSRPFHGLRLTEFNWKRKLFLVNDFKKVLNTVHAWGAFGRPDDDWLLVRSDVGREN